jgi:hypothetical protein
MYLIVYLILTLMVSKLNQLMKMEMEMEKQFNQLMKLQIVFLRW